MSYQERMSNIKVKIITKEHCIKCRMTKNILKSKGITYTEKVLKSPEDFSFYRDLGYRSMPIVFVKDDSGKVVDKWNDFQVTKIEAL